MIPMENTAYLILLSCPFTVSRKIKITEKRIYDKIIIVEGIDLLILILLLDNVIIKDELQVIKIYGYQSLRFKEVKVNCCESKIIKIVVAYRIPEKKPSDIQASKKSRIDSNIATNIDCSKRVKTTTNEKIERSRKKIKYGYRSIFFTNILFINAIFNYTQSLSSSSIPGEFSCTRDCF